ncbi:DUF2752 domain-containing protein [Salinimicrobium sp. CDJ15-81-2]|nr:DUF2752 domain-containing protein [Salinimicrobium nanhaiense]
MVTIKFIKPGVIALGFLLLLVLYASFDPAQASFFPACPFHSLTGFLCPGCGSQRALHHLLNLQFSTAYSYNPLLIIALPYILAGTVVDHLSKPSEALLKWRKIFFGRNAIMIVLLIIISFWILRNL